ncbi:GIY-YIG nuclease family protein [Brevibacillus ginsengisoli]|uniref:GIY-YIG nuclease family protein n=1 Tax=Brevibacillus ginsengisoli TaxID=363854 RepID=UPI003CED9679
MAELDRNEKNLRKLAYKEQSTRIGAFQIRNLANDKVFIRTGRNLDSMINRYRFTLTHRLEDNKELQADWNQYGEEQFVFEIIELIKDEDLTTGEIKKQLEEMEQRLLQQLDPTKSYRRKNT